MKTKSILNSCIFEILNKNNFTNIYVYGSENLEIEKLIYSQTSSSIIGGDVDFYNTQLGNYFSYNSQKVELPKQLKENFNLKDYDALEEKDKVSLLLIYKTYKNLIDGPTIHNRRVFNNIQHNLEELLEKTKEQLNSTALKLSKYVNCDLVEFAQCITKEDILIIDNRTKNNINTEVFKKINSYLIISTRNILYLKNDLVLQAKGLYLYSNLHLRKKMFNNQKKSNCFLSFEVSKEDGIDNIQIKQLSLQQFNSLRKKYLSKRIHYLGTPKVCYGLFSNDKLFGAFGICNDYRNKAPAEIEQPCIYLMSDFSVSSKIKLLSKLVLYCVLSSEVKLRAERLINKEVKSIYTNVFTKNKSSNKYRGLFTLINRKILDDMSFNLGYYAEAGRWTLREGLELWKQKSYK